MIWIREFWSWCNFAVYLSVWVFSKFWDSSCFYTLFHNNHHKHFDMTKSWIPLSLIHDGIFAVEKLIALFFSVIFINFKYVNYFLKTYEEVITYNKRNNCWQLSHCTFSDNGSIKLLEKRVFNQFIWFITFRSSNYLVIIQDLNELFLFLNYFMNLLND